MNPKPEITLTVAGEAFPVRLEEALAPSTVAAFVQMLPWRSRVIHARWSGEAMWIPLGDLRLELPWENATAYPAPGQILFYPGGISETEVLIPYGSAAFGSKAGQLAGSHFGTIVAGIDKLVDLGQRVLWEGAQDADFALTSDGGASS